MRREKSTNLRVHDPTSDLKQRNLPTMEFLPTNQLTTPTTIGNHQEKPPTTKLKTAGSSTKPNVKDQRPPSP